MRVLYRISDNGYAKTKFPFATKIDCLENFTTVWNVGGNHYSEIDLFLDHVAPETLQKLEDFRTTQITFRDIDAGSSAKSWRVVRDYALENFPDDEIVYFVEDDYLHCHGSREYLLEAMGRADYVTLYDAPDKYVPAKAGGNPFIGDDGADISKVILTKNRHWRLTNSTTMTFACRVKTLREDKSIWDKWTEGSHPHDFECFLELRNNGRALLSPLPSLSTHCEPAWAAPLVNWEQVARTTTSVKKVPVVV